MYEKLKEVIEGKFVFKGKTLCINAGIGIAVYPEQGTDFDSLNHMADMSMYDDKQRMKSQK